MHIGRIADATHILGAPDDWDKQKQGHCAGLPVRKEVTNVGLQMTSAWLPTPEEIARIAAGAPIYLTVVGGMHPPVAMTVGPIPE